VHVDTAAINGMNYARVCGDVERHVREDPGSSRMRQGHREDSLEIHVVENRQEMRGAHRFQSRPD